jgi:uncharacterized repeat protein (TIGR01451 family)
MFHADAVGQAHFLLSDWTGDKGVFVMETNGNQFVQKTLPDLRYLSFELNSVGTPYFLGLDMIQYSNLLSIEPARVQQDRESAISQTISIPADMETPILSFFYLYNGLIGDESNSFDVLLDDGQVSTLWQQSQVDERWRHQWFDLTPWKGETVTLTFQLHQEQQALNTWAFLDSVTVGSANPDVWVTAGRVHGLPNEQIEHTLTYGNRGGAVAAGTRLTYTLPAELSFVSASLPPISTSPLVWDLGDLSAKSEPMTLSVVVQVAPTAVPFTTLSSMAVLSAISTELELLNNSARGETLVSHQVYLPVIHK